MEVRVIFYDVLHQYNPTSQLEITEFVTNFDNNTSLQQLFEEAGHTISDLSDYYYLSGAFSFNCNYLPFIINSSGKIDWNISFQDAKVIDFISTHRINSNTINAKIGLVQAGGAGFKDLIEIWNMVYPILDQVSTMLSLVRQGGRLPCLLFLVHIVFC